MRSGAISRGGRCYNPVGLLAQPEGVRQEVTQRIVIDPAVMLGKPVIRGTRITVELILRKLAEGATEQELLDAYPRLTREDIQAALAYAAEVVAHESIVLQTV